MKIGQLCATFVSIGLMALPGAALAEASQLQVIIGGEAYDGPPRFEITFDGTILGQAAVAAAIDTDKAGRFADAPDKTPYVQSFEFDVPEDLFRQDGEVRVRLINEAYGGDGSNRDRNLYLAAIVVNGGAVTVSGLVTATSDGFKPNDLLGEFLVLKDGGEEGVSPAPRGGWPMPNVVVAELVEPRLQPTVDVAAAPAMMPVPGIAQIETPETGVSDESETAAAIGVADDGEDSLVAEVAAPEEVEAMADETASIARMAEGCALDQIYNVLGFNENSNDLTPRLMTRLDQILEDIGNEKCRVQITGYSSTQGDHATNALFAVERAQNVLTYLREKGLQYSKVNATGAGATEQFGPGFAANRRVVITVTP
jgi:outer membrane protein OmpA-like peptidoglycan-associated protein